MKKGKILVVGLIGLLMVGGLMLAGCKDDKGPCPTGGKCRVDGSSVSGNWCAESRCKVSQAGTNYTDHCDC